MFFFSIPASMSGQCSAKQTKVSHFDTNLKLEDRYILLCTKSYQYILFCGAKKRVENTDLYVTFTEALCFLCLWSWPSE